MQQKTLSFQVDDQFIRAPRYRVVADSKHYLIARFSFSECWQGLTKTAVFTGADGAVYHMLLEGDACLVPAEVIRPTQFLISVFGGDRLTTDQALVEVKASGCTEGITPPAPTPDVYTQLTDAVNTERQLAQAAAVSAGEKAEQCGNAAVMALDAEERAAASCNQAYFYASEASGAEQTVRVLAQTVQEQTQTATKSAEDAADSADTAGEKADTATAAAREAHNYKLQCEEIASFASDSAWNAQLSAQAAAEAMKDTVTNTQLEEMLSAHTSFRPWILLNEISLTEAVTKIDEGLYGASYDEIWLEGTIKIETDYTSNKTGALRLEFSRQCSTHFEYWSGIANGSTHYIRAHGYKTPSGRVVLDTVHSSNYYLTNTAQRTTGGPITAERKFNQCIITLSEESGAAGIRFGVGTTFKVWGR